MTHKRFPIIVLIMITVLMTSLACGASTVSSNDSSTTQIRQWASSANASSEFGSVDWSAQQAIGAPDTTVCGDEVTAWASSSYSSVEWLDVGFAKAVIPTQINIYESYNPGSIVRIEVRDTSGSFHTIWEGTPSYVSTCPRIFTININTISFKVDAVLITIDQSVLLDWDEIDAVELVGTP